MTPPPAERPLVLLVEDDRDSRDMYAMGLDHFGLRVLPAATASEALQACDTERPDVVVTDLSLPDMDGIVLCERLRALFGPRAVPILVLTGRSCQEDVAAAAAAGARRLIVKPCTPDALADAIREALGG